MMRFIFIYFGVFGFCCSCTRVALSQNTPSADVKAEARFDYASSSGTMPDYILGTSGGPSCSQESIRVLKAAGFKVISVSAWISEPGSEPDGRPGPRPMQNGAPSADRRADRIVQQVRDLYAAGIEPVVVMAPDKKPSDMAAFEERIKQCLEKIKSARDGKDLVVTRFANEPDFSRFWKGTEEEFFQTYEVWAKTVHKVSPGTILQSPGFMSPTKENISDRFGTRMKGFCTGFLQYCSKNKIPLDVFSFHFYGGDMKDLESEITAVRKELDRCDGLSPHFGKPKIAIDEWNIHVGTPTGLGIFDMAWTASHNVQALMLMIRNDVWLSVRWGGIDFEHARQGRDEAGTAHGPRGFGAVVGSGDFLMSKADGTLKPVYYACSAFNEMQSTPCLLKTGPQTGCGAIAGRSEDGKRIIAIVSFYDATVAGTLMQSRASTDESTHAKVQASTVIGNFPWDKAGDMAHVSSYVVDDSKKNEKVHDWNIKRNGDNTDLVIPFAATVPSVVILKIELP